MGIELFDGYVAAQGAAAAGVGLSVASSAAIAAGITTAVGLFGFFVYRFVQCKRAKVYVPDEFVEDRLTLRTYPVRLGPISSN